jgi:hypothetical protein
MKEKTLATNTATPEVQIKANGDLSLKGTDRQEVSAATRYTANLTLRQEGEVIQVICLDDCSVSLPSGATVSVERVGGDSRVTNLTGALHMQKVGGDLALIEVGAVDIERVGGDCLAKDIQGSLNIQQVGGDFTGQAIQGAINLEKVGGDITLQGAGGAAEGRAGGDLRLGFANPQLPASNLRCGGDLELFIQPGSSGVFNINSNGEDIVLNLEGRHETIEERSYTLTLGTGGDTSTLQAGGDVIITDKTWTEDIISEFPDQPDMESLRQLDVEIDAHVERVTRRAEEAARRAEHRIQAAMNRMENANWGMDRGIRQNMLKGLEGLKNLDSLRGKPFGAPQPARDPVTDDERLMVLKMVQDKKISVEEAEKLLRAMEGKK